MSQETGNRLNKVADKLFEGNKSRMARAMGMTPQAANKYFQGEREPGFKFLKRLVSIGINASWVVAGIPPMEISDIENAQVSRISYPTGSNRAAIASESEGEDDQDYFADINEEDLSDAERQLLGEVMHFSNFLKKRDLNPYVKRLLLELLIESIDQAKAQPQRGQDDS